MAAEQIAKSNETERDVSTLNINNLNISKTTPEQRAELSKKITQNPDNIQQIREVKKVFPDLRKSWDNDKKSDFTKKLNDEITGAISELKDLWDKIDYSPEITSEDEKRIEDLSFVIEHKDKIPESYSKLEMKANEVAEEMEKDIKKEWLDRNLNQ